MRWTFKKKPEYGDTRKIVQFLWLPKVIGNEIRWLEFAGIRQIYNKKPLNLAPGYKSYWQNVEWLEIQTCYHADGTPYKVV